MIFILIALFLILSGLAVTIFMISRGSNPKKKSLVEGLPLGSIVAWNDTTIPDGWTICDGTNNTPDLRNRFIIGSNDNYPLNSTGGNSSVVISSGNMPGNIYLYVQYGFNPNCDGSNVETGCTTTTLCPSSNDFISCESASGTTTINYALGGKDNPDPINIIPSSTYMIYIKKISNGNDLDCIGVWYGGDQNINSNNIPEILKTTNIKKGFIIGDDGTNLKTNINNSSNYLITLDNLPSKIYQYNFAGNSGGGDNTIWKMFNIRFGNYCNMTNLLAEGDKKDDSGWSQQKVSLLPPFLSLPYCSVYTGIPSGFIVAIDTDNIPEGWILCDGNNNTPNLGGRIPRSCDGECTDYNSSGGSEKLYLNKDNIPRYQTIDMNANINGDGDVQCYARMGKQPLSNGCKGQWDPNDPSVEDINCPFGRVTGGNPNPDPIPLLPPYVALNFIMKL